MEGWPEIGHGLQFYRRAFSELHSAQPQGMGGAGPIPWTAIDRWAERHGVTDPDDFEDLVLYVQVMDRTWQEYQSEQSGKGESGKQGDGDDVVEF